MKTINCRACGAAIFFVLSASGKSVPLDAVPADNGNYEIGDDGIARVVTKERICEIEEGSPLYLSHFATCPDAKKFRKKGV